MTASRTCLAGVVFLGLAQSTYAQAHATAAAVQAVRVSEAPRLDGHLDDAAWRGVEPATVFTQRDPDEGKPATERTELRVVFDASALYVGVRLHDADAARIVRRLSRRDDDADADRFTHAAPGRRSSWSAARSPYGFARRRRGARTRVP